MNLIEFCNKLASNEQIQNRKKFIKYARECKNGEGLLSYRNALTQALQNLSCETEKVIRLFSDLCDKGSVNSDDDNALRQYGFSANDRGIERDLWPAECVPAKQN